MPRLQLEAADDPHDGVDEPKDYAEEHEEHEVEEAVILDELVEPADVNLERDEENVPCGQDLALSALKRKKADAERDVEEK